MSFSATGSSCSQPNNSKFKFFLSEAMNILCLAQILSLCFHVHCSEMSSLRCNLPTSYPCHHPASRVRRQPLCETPATPRGCLSSPKLCWRWLELVAEIQGFRSKWCHIGSLKLTMMGAFPLWKSTNAINQNFFFFQTAGAPDHSWQIFLPLYDSIMLNCHFLNQYAWIQRPVLLCDID